MAKSTSGELLDRLKTSLPKATSSTFVPPPVTVPIPAAAAEPVAPPAAPAPPSAGKPANAPKLSVSLYPTDLERLDQIKIFMQQHGFRNLSDSEALRLACRAVVINEQFLEIFRAMQHEDGRRRKKAEG